MTFTSGQDQILGGVLWLSTKESGQDNWPELKISTGSFLYLRNIVGQEHKYQGERLINKI